MYKRDKNLMIVAHCRNKAFLYLSVRHLGKVELLLLRSERPCMLPRDTGGKGGEVENLDYQSF